MDIISKPASGSGGNANGNGNGATQGDNNTNTNNKRGRTSLNNAQAAKRANTSTRLLTINTGAPNRAAANALRVALFNDAEAVTVMPPTQLASADAPHVLLIQASHNFLGGGTVALNKASEALAHRNFYTPGVLPVMHGRSHGYTRPLSLVGEIIALRAIMDGANNQHQGWESVSATNPDGTYNPRVWDDIRYGVRQTRGAFGWITVGIRFMPSLLNRGGNDSEADTTWLEGNALSTKNVMTPDGGRSYFFVLHLKTPHVAPFLELVSRNERFAESFAGMRRPLVCFNNLTFSYSSHAGAMELQTLAHQRGSVCPNTTFCWVNNYADLPAGYAARVYESFTNPTALPAPVPAPAVAATEDQEQVGAGFTQRDDDEESESGKVTLEITLDP